MLTGVQVTALSQTDIPNSRSMTGYYNNDVAHSIGSILSRRIKNQLLRRLHD
jgi:hypothetical protein